jgi:hypothetical protein
MAQIGTIPPATLASRSARLGVENGMTNAEAALDG